MRPVACSIAAVALALVIGACGGSGDDGDKGGNGAGGGNAGSGRSGGNAGGDQGTGLPLGGEEVALDPADFSVDIDNPYWPMRPGARWVYREREDGATQRVVVTATGDTKKVAAGITGRVLHDIVTEGGEKVEDTYDWYAQDRDGNIWYLGEDTTEFEDGKAAGTEGSWEAGVDGAQAGIIMPADPEVGMRYRQEYYEGHAEDEGRVLSLDEQAEVPFGHWEDVLMTRDTTPLEPKLVEHKFYARGVGPVLTVAVSGSSGREELMRFDDARP